MNARAMTNTSRDVHTLSRWVTPKSVTISASSMRSISIHVRPAVYQAT